MEAIIAARPADIAAAAAGEITTALFNSFVDFVDRSEKTTRSYLTNLKQFMAWLKYEAISKPARQDVICYRNWLGSEHKAISFEPDSVTGWIYRTDSNGNAIVITCKPATIKAYMQSVKQFFSWTAANNLYPNIAVNIHSPKVTSDHKKESLTASEVQTIEQSIARNATAKQEAAAEASKDKAGRLQRSTEQGKRLYAMYLLAVNAGLRTVEISRARIKDLEIKDGKAYLYIYGKGCTEANQKKPIAQEVQEAIADYLSSRTDNPTSNSPLFTSTGNRSKGKPIASTTISTMLKAALKEAGFNSERLTAHSLRHTAAQNVLAITGDNIYKTQLYMRHSSPKTTEIYLENNSTAADAVIAEQLYKHYHGTEQASSGEQLRNLIEELNPDKLDQLLAVAKAMQ